MKRLIVSAIALTIAATVPAALVAQDNLERATLVSTLFTGAEQYENFNRMPQIFPNARVAAPDKSMQFPAGAEMELPEKFTYGGHEIATGDFLKETDTSALLVLKDGKIRYENYMLTGGQDVNWLSMSVAKSIVSALIGIAIEEGHIASIEEPITKYVPSLAGSAYDGVRIKDILQMSSGARWNEDYGDPNSDIMRFGRVFAMGESMNAFAATLEREREPGTYNLYNSTDTQVLGMLLVNATGRSITDYTEEKLWRPIGMEHDGFWLTDDSGMEMAFGGMNATARDYAKIGELYRNNGNWHGVQIVPADWVEASVTPDAPHLQPGDNPNSDTTMGYGYQWWVLDGDEGEYSAIGVYNQFIYVNPKQGLVIVKLSANSDYGTPKDALAESEFKTVEFFRAIGAALGE